MLLIDHSLKEFTLRLASAAPTPGGGAVAALGGALGASLVNMVGMLTEGNPKYAENADYAAELNAQARELRCSFLKLVDADAEAFNMMSAVYKMPKDSEADKSARREAMRSALKSCAKPPMAMMELSLQALTLAAGAVGKTNANAVSDIGVAALCLKAAVQSAWLNILINLAGIKDKDFINEYRAKGESILEQALPLADDIYERVKNLL